MLKLSGPASWPSEEMVGQEMQGNMEIGPQPYSITAETGF